MNFELRPHDDTSAITLLALHNTLKLRIGAIIRPCTSGLLFVFTGVASDGWCGRDAFFFDVALALSLPCVEFRPLG
jgi:hypothetical protein